ncbi:hypothetical protein PISMIDRAFT_688542 [Pisolithus microcarpus 441]|uniref:Uncharacterized protein n=1 Tax=Pisolithus microcarpus 441 TaxID=765257 RepID=A0A0C9Y9R8_9AGAM|nr:hypothetical protein PISMIDRAFT_688542 [Pisolithus microcarpus 441]
MNSAALSGTSLDANVQTPHPSLLSTGSPGNSSAQATIAKLVVFLCRLWLEGSVKIKWGRGSMHLEGARAEGIGASDEGGAGED